MNKRITDLIYQRNSLASLLVFFAICAAPSIVYCLLSPDCIVSMFIVVLEGLFAARVVRNIGIFVLREPVQPWYARLWSLALLLVSGPLVNILFIWVDCAIFTISPMPHDTPQWARILALIPIEFSWIILLDWRSISTTSSEPNWRHIPQNLHLKP